MYENFIPELWAKELMVDARKRRFLKNLCYNGPLLGDIKNLGDRVKIAGIGRPTMRAYTKGGTLTTEYLEDSVQELLIDRAYYFKFAIDDIDAKQAAGEIESMQLVEARRALAEEMDEYIGGLHGSASTTIGNTAATSATIISTIAQGYTALLKNNVPSSEEVALVVSPDVAEKIVLADIVFNTDNSKSLMGFVGNLKRFLNCSVFVSNNIAVENNVNQCMMLTKKGNRLC